MKAVYSPEYYYASVADPYQVAATASRDQLTADAAAFRALKLLVDAGMLPKVTGQQTQVRVAFPQVFRISSKRSAQPVIRGKRADST